MILHDTNRFLKMLNDTKRYSEIQLDSKRYREIQHDTQRFLKILNVTKRYRDILLDSERFIKEINTHVDMFTFFNAGSDKRQYYRTSLSIFILHCLPVWGHF